MRDIRVDCRHILKGVDDGFLPVSFKTVKVKLFELEGMVHTIGSCRRARSVSYAYGHAVSNAVFDPKTGVFVNTPSSSSSQPVTVVKAVETELSLGDVVVLEKEFCPNCATGFPSNGLFARAAMFSLGFARASQCLVLKPGGLKAGSLSTKRRQLQSLETFLLGDNSSLLQTEATELLGLVQKALGWVGKLFADDSTRGVLEAFALKEMGATGFVKDESLVLVGVGGRVFNKKLEEFISAYAVRVESVVTVCLMPRFVYDFFQRQLFSSSNASMLHCQGVPADGVPGDVCETAAGLWDPVSDLVEFRDLNRVLLTASELTS